MRLTDLIHAVDAHAEGESSRVVVGGVLDVPGATMDDKRRHLQQHGDWLREYLLYEPRGHPSLAADVILPTCHPEADAGFVIMGASGYFPMSGTNLICVVTVLLETGMLPMREPRTELVLDTPAGLVRAVAACKDGACRRVTFENVPSFAVQLDADVEVEGHGTVRADVAWGGAFFALVDARELGFALTPDEAADLGRIGERIKVAAAEQIPVRHPQRADEHESIIFTHFHGPPRDGGHGRSANIVGPGRVDRSPCGTGTSAKLAVAAARGRLGVGERYVNESIISTTFEARILARTSVGEHDAVVPQISGGAWITGVHQFGRDPEDPIRSGFTLGDTWGPGQSSGEMGPAPAEEAAR